MGGAGEKLRRYTTLNCNWNIVSESKEDQLLIEDRMADRLVGWERASDGWRLMSVLGFRAKVWVR